MKNNKISIYFKAILKSCNVIAYAVAGLFAVLVSYLLESSNVVEVFGKLNNLSLIFILVPVIIGSVLLVVAIIRGLFEKQLNVADSTANTLIIASILFLVYALVGVNTDNFLWRLITFIILAVLAVFLTIVRIKCCDGSSNSHKIDTPKANATAQSYYKEFFKKYLVFAVIFAVLAIAGLVLLDQANFITTLFGKANISATLSVFTVFIVGFLTLYFARIKDRDIDFIDVVLFMMIFAGLGLLVLTFIVNSGTKLLVGIFAVLTLGLSILLTYFAIKNTHIDTTKEKDEYSHLKSGFKVYVASFKKHVNLLPLVSVALITASVVAVLLLTGVGSNFINSFNLKNRKEFTIAVLVISMVVFTVMFCDVRLHRIETMDVIFAVSLIVSIIALVIDQLIMKQGYVIGGLFFTATTVVSIAFLLVRTMFVKEKEQINQVVNAITEEVSEQAQAVVEAETAVAVAPEVAVEEQETAIKLKRVNVKKSYEIYLRTGDEQLKENYSLIRNELESFGMHARMTKLRENFSKKGTSLSKVKPDKNVRLQAKLLIRGKFLKLYLNVDPSTIDAKYYRIKDVSEKMPDQACYIKVRSKLSVKRAIELINILATNQGFTKKKKFEKVDYVSLYGDENLSYMQKLGYDYMVKPSVEYSEVLAYKDDWAERVIKSKIIEDAERYIYDEISLERLELEYNDGDEVTLESLRARSLIKVNANHLTITPSKSLSKKLLVEANAIDLKTAQMVIIAGGEVTRLVFN